MKTKPHKKGFGAVIDTRPDADKAKDFTFEELVASVNPVTWATKKKWRTFPIYDQNGSGSCVAQTTAKMLGIMYWLINNTYVHFSATHIYQRRSNKPSAGMIGTNAGDIARTGVTLEELVPSQKMTDKEMDTAKIAEYKAKVGEVFKIANYVQVTKVGDIDTIASIIQTTGKPVMVWFYFKSDEWTTIPTVKYPTLTVKSAPARHSVTAVDFTLLGKEHTSDKTLWGKKAIVIDDSWGTKYGAAGQRFITEDFFAARNWFALYFTNFNFTEGVDTTKPRYTFNRDLEYTPTVSYGDADVIALQNILKYEGLFPQNVESTGYFGAVTKKAVIDYQLKHDIAPAEGYVGQLTRAKLNSDYSN